MKLIPYRVERVVHRVRVGALEEGRLGRVLRAQLVKSKYWG